MGKKKDNQHKPGGTGGSRSKGRSSSTKNGHRGTRNGAVPPSSSGEKSSFFRRILPITLALLVAAGITYNRRDRRIQQVVEDSAPMSEESLVPSSDGGVIPNLPALLEGKVDRKRIPTRDDMVAASELIDRGNRAISENRLFDSIDLLVKAIASAPTEPESYNSLAGALQFLGRRAEAIEVLDEGERNAIAARGADYPRLAFIYRNKFLQHSSLGHRQQAEEAIKRACELDPKAENYQSWASISRSPSEKIELLTKSLEMNPEFYPAFCQRAYAYAAIPDWDKAAMDHEQLVAYQERSIREATSDRTQEQRCLEPMQLAHMNVSAELLKQTNMFISKKEVILNVEQVLPPLRPSQIEPVFDLAHGLKRLRKTRIGYVSSDFNQHPVGRIMSGVFLNHNKEKYDVFTFSTKRAAKAGDPVAQLIEQHTTMVDISNMGDHGAVARLVRETYKIDILVDLNGWTKGHRLPMFAARPAPVQITHGVGFAGTVGSDAIDYFITDDVASPHRFSQYYTENLIRLPQAYLPASHFAVQVTPPGFDPATADKAALRKEHGLPADDRFVFCSFQGVNRMSGEAFDAWMRILTASPNSILWMTRPKPSQREALTKRAETSFGIDPSRLVWGGFIGMGDHMVRAQACDLMLDSWPYTAHSTGLDTIYSGVPLVVYLPDYHDPDSPVKSSQMASRVSASLLHTLGMPQLIRSTVEDFEREAVRLSQDPQSYNSIREEFLHKRSTTKLFDIRSYTRYLEMAYGFAHMTFLNGRPPRPWNSSSFFEKPKDGPIPTSSLEVEL